MQKRLIIAVAGSEAGREFKDVAILPNTRAIDVLNKLGLTGFQLARPEGGMFAHTDNLYDAFRPDLAGRFNSRVLKGFTLEVDRLWKRVLPTTAEIVEMAQAMINAR